MCDHNWIVFSTALKDVSLMLICDRCGANGTINDPTIEEWEEAFYAPSNPYEWRGGDHRVDIREDRLYRLDGIPPFYATLYPIDHNAKLN